jgi:hypothetical protein
MFRWTEEAEGAIPNGSRVRKINSEEGDAHDDGSLGTVVGSMDATGLPEDLLACLPEHLVSEYVYFVAWDADPELHVGTMGAKVEVLG